MTMQHRNILQSMWLIALFIVIILTGCSERHIEFYVGSQRNVSPKDRSAEYMFADIHAALEQGLRIRQENKKAFITIHVQPGDYHLSSPLVIPSTLSDLRIKGAGASSVTLKGSLPLKPVWAQYDERICVAAVTDSVAFEQLVVNGELQTLARYPNYDAKGEHWDGYAPDAIAKERIASWKHPVGAVVHAMHNSGWGDFHYVVTGVDQNGEATLSGGHQNNRQSGLHKNYRMVENVFEELDSPGEWFLDTDKHLLYYWPKPGINVDEASFEGVNLKNLITIQGSADEPVRNVTIEGIRFEYTTRTLMESYEPLLRSDWCIYRGGAIYMEGAESCSVENCELTDLGGNAVFVSGYNRSINISGNHIHEIGASGVCFVGDPSAVRSPSFEYHQFVPHSEMDTVSGPANDLYPSGCVAVNNLIHRTGRIEKQSAGIQISMAMDIRIFNNSIYEVPRAGINIGDGCWGGHIIEGNDVFNTVLETSDHGAFNSWGRDRFWHPDRPVMDSLVAVYPEMPQWDAIHTTVIRNNRFRCDHGWDIDLDDGSSNYQIYNNLCLVGGIKLREGFCRTVENNIIINNGFHPHVWFENSRDIFRRNIVAAAHKDIRLKGWGLETDYNLFPDKAALLRVRVNGTDEHSNYGDPMFVNAPDGDFRVRDGSPALKLGFENFPMDRFGVRDSALIQITQNPGIPALLTFTDDQQHRSPAVNWLGAHIKNVESMAERSAAGLSETSGVIVLETDKDSAVSPGGLQKGDVIIRAEGVTVDRVSQLMAVYQEKKHTGRLTLTIFRNQAEQQLFITF